jgi:hypothetical protein
MQRFEGHGERLWVDDFKNADQAEAFRAWSESCGIDWSVPQSAIGCSGPH